MKILVTGGAGYIGSTVASALLDHGHTPVVLDDLSTGRAEFVADRVFYEGDVGDAELVRRIFAEHPDIDATVHCAASIVVPESVAEPASYYDNNVAKTVRLLQTLAEVGSRRFLFSSSASIYAPGTDFAVTEESAIAAKSPYARTKAMVEQILEDCAAAGAVEAISLRYFNPIGADPQLRTGLQIMEASHVLGKLITASENGDTFQITGVDWPTRDGTGIRDYIHVWDLAQAHVTTLESFESVLGEPSTRGYQALNVGTGTGTTVREMVDAFIRVAGVDLSVEDTDPRPGDVVGAYARDPRLTKVLGWRAELSIDQGIRDSLSWRRIWRSKLDAS